MSLFVNSFRHNRLSLVTETLFNRSPDCIIHVLKGRKNLFLVGSYSAKRRVRTTSFILAKYSEAAFLSSFYMDSVSKARCVARHDEGYLEQPFLWLLQDVDHRKVVSFCQGIRCLVSRGCVSFFLFFSLAFLFLCRGTSARL